VQAAEELLSMYKKEFELKKTICENICHSENKTEILFMLAAWKHEPYLEDAVAVHTQAMIRETGHET